MPCQGQSLLGHSYSTGRWLTTYFSAKCAISLIAFGVLLVLVVPPTWVSLALLPSFNKTLISPSTGRKDNMMEVRFGTGNPWIESATLSLDKCDGSFYIINGHSCIDLRANYTQVYTHDDGIDYTHWFMLPGSSIEYTLAESGSVYIWVFTNFTDYLNNHPLVEAGTLECGRFPKWCTHLYNPNPKYPAIKSVKMEEASNYFVVIENMRDLRKNLRNITVYRKSYSPQKVAQNFKGIPFSSAQSITFSFNNSRFIDFRDSCVLANIIECYISESGGTSVFGVYHGYVTKRRDPLFFGIILLILASLFGFILCLCFSCICCTPLRDKIKSKCLAVSCY